MIAECKRDCFNSTSGRLYEAGKKYEVDESSGFAQANFNVPQPKEEQASKAGKKPKKTTPDGSPNSGAAQGGSPDEEGGEGDDD